MFTSTRKKISEKLRQSILKINVADNSIGRSILTSALRKSIMISNEAPRQVIQANRIATRI